MGTIKINNKSISKLYLGNIAVKRAYSNGSIVYDTGVQPTPKPCFEVVSKISQASGDYVDVYVKGESKWYKKNNLNKYEKYGVIEYVTDFSPITYYTGKLVILLTNNHEYKWNGSEWIDLGAKINVGGNQFEYIQGNGESYIVTDYIPVTDSRYEIDIEGRKASSSTTSDGECHFLGGYDNIGTDTNCMKILYPGTDDLGDGGIRFDYADQRIQSRDSRIITRGVIKIDKTGGYFNDSKIVTFSNPASITDSHCHCGIFATRCYDSSTNTETNQSGSIVYNGKIYDFKIYENDVLVRHFVPAVINNVVGMYDKETGTMFGSYVSTPFTVGGTSTEIVSIPEEYPTKVAPSNNVHYNTLKELELMECPWIGMKATVGQEYTTYVYTENGWVIGDVPLDLPYLRFTATEDTTFTFTKSSYASQDLELKYSIDDRLWNIMESGVATPIVKSGSYVLFKSNFKGGSGSPYGDNDNGFFSSTGKFSLSGNIMSLIYGDEFVGKTSLADYTNVFANLFYNCKNLKSISKELLPATTLSNQCYSHLFNNCTGITSLPKGLLPATNLAYKCYEYMFFNCVGITSLPKGLLPATDLKDYCYSCMFYGSGIKSIPLGFLPSTNLAEGCYSSMFSKTKVTSIPSNLLPATTLTNYCYYRLFCETKITSVPDGLLHATNLSDYCYQEIFSECERLKLADIVLPATTVNNTWAYYRMFFNCTNLLEPPTIKATSVSGNNPFGEMFYGCQQMKYLVCDILNEPSSSISSDWLKGVAATGTFYKNPDATWGQTITPGTSTIPSGWTITDIPTANYLKFTTVDDNGSTYAFSKSGLEYSIDGGEWTTLKANTNTPNIPKGSNIRFRGHLIPNGSEGIGTFSSSGKFDAEGELITLLYGESYVGQTNKYDNYIFSGLFMNSNVVDATNLVIPNAMRDYCYYKTFYSCKSLTSTPSLPFSQVGYYSCRDMFSGCISLITIQPMTIEGNSEGSMYNMFNNCKSLVDASMITITSEKSRSCYNMFNICKNLRKSPIIKGDMTSSSCERIFYGCSNLSEVTYLGTTSPSSSYSRNWMKNVASTGTFYMRQDATWDSTVSRDANGVPAGWTIVKVDPNNY